MSDVLGFAPVPGTIDALVFDQDVYWADVNGFAHELVNMTPLHLRNVLALLARSKIRLWIDAHAEQNAGRALRALLEGPGRVDDAGDWSTPEVDTTPTEEAAARWLEATPLVLMIRQLLASTPKTTRTDLE